MNEDAESRGVKGQRKHAKGGGVFLFFPWKNKMQRRGGGGEGRGGGAADPVNPDTE